MNQILILPWLSDVYDETGGKPGLKHIIPNLAVVNSTLAVVKISDIIQENFVIDKNGRKIAVQVPINTYEKLVDDSEELDEIKEYRKAKAQKGNAIPSDQAFREIEEAVK